MAESMIYIDGRKIVDTNGGGVTANGVVASRAGTLAEQVARANASGRQWVMTAEGPVFVPQPVA